MPSIFALVACVLLLPSVPAAQAASDWAELPIPSVCEAPPEAWPVTDRPSGSHLDLEPARAAIAAPPTTFALPLPALLELLENDARRAGDDLRCVRTAPPVLARGSAAALERARALVEDLDRAGLAQRVRDAVVLAGASERRFERTVRSGEPLRLGDRETHAFLADFDVDVATGSGTADPELGLAHTGEAIDLWVWRAPGGDGAFVRGRLDLSTLAALEEFDLESSDLGTIEIPRVSVCEVWFSGRVRSGEPLRVTVAGSSAGDLELTVVATTASDPEDAGWRVADLAWFEAESFRPALPEPGAGLLAPRRSFDGPVLEPLSSANVLGELEVGFATRRGNRPIFAVAPGVLVAPTEDEALWTGFDRLAAAADRSRSATRRVDVEQDGVRVSFPVAFGVGGRVLLGEERTAVVDYQTEIAPEFWLADPVVERVLDGLMIDARFAGGELLGSWWSARSEEARELDPDATFHGRAPALRRTLASGTLRVAPGGATDLGGARVSFQAR